MVKGYISLAEARATQGVTAPKPGLMSRAVGRTPTRSARAPMARACPLAVPLPGGEPTHVPS